MKKSKSETILIKKYNKLYDLDFSYIKDSERLSINSDVMYFKEGFLKEEIVLLFQSVFDIFDDIYLENLIASKNSFKGVINRLLIILTYVIENIDIDKLYINEKIYHYLVDNGLWDTKLHYRSVKKMDSEYSEYLEISIDLENKDEKLAIYTIDTIMNVVFKTLIGEDNTERLNDYLNNEFETFQKLFFDLVLFKLLFIKIPEILRETNDYLSNTINLTKKEKIIKFDNFFDNRLLEIKNDMIKYFSFIDLKIISYIWPILIDNLFV